ncbi:phage late control D family protein [Kutzneria albida]|uniref:Phage protein D n=1 Tax=Kutzneria albida DSM 43870 TaxID=1449976 RepID=W5WE61_9PSEU|nr:contractile injection system protein, VgrG/Pvc8 family [Kutzneria albida]AHH99473.1 hypothetical protein KALB_6113 [Kutzneria albida DSM 43870]
MTDPVVANASPVFTVDGELSRDLARDCVRLEIEEGLEGLRTLRAHLIAIGPGTTGPQQRMLHLDGRGVDLGKALRVAIGPATGQRYAFEGTVSAIEAVFGDGEPPVVVVHAEDALMRLRMTRRCRTYREVTDAEIAAEVAAAHGLTADVAVDGPRYDVVQQANQSDLAFLRERARLVRAELWCTGRTLHLRSRANRAGTPLTLVRGNHLLSVRLCADLAHQRSEVVVTGYDAQARQVINERAGAEVVDAEISGGRTGARLVGRALGGAGSLRVREVALTSGEAAAWARAEMLRRARRFVTVQATTRGTPDLVVGSQLRLEQVGAPFEGGGYHVTRVVHTFDNVRGLRTRFEAERATVNEVV